MNAFALPGGVIVVLDELVELARNDDSVLGVLGHELGPVVHRHATRQLFQALGVGALAGLVWGDFSSAAANAPIVLGVMRYGPRFRDRSGRLRDRLPARERRVAARAGVHRSRRVGVGRQPSRRLPDFLSTHPSSRERSDRLLREAEAFERNAK